MENPIASVIESPPSPNTGVINNELRMIVIIIIKRKANSFDIIPPILL
jgi:hypothetical protein